MPWFSLAETIIGVFGKTLDKFVADQDKKLELQNELIKVIEDNSASIQKIALASAGKNVLAEIQGESWLQRNWRPLLMSVITVIVANNYILFPYLSVFTDKVHMLDLPPNLFTLMEIGVGGYMLSRGAEKGIKAWKAKE